MEPRSAGPSRTVCHLRPRQAARRQGLARNPAPGAPVSSIMPSTGRPGLSAEPAPFPCRPDSALQMQTGQSCRFRVLRALPGRRNEESVMVLWRRPGARHYRPRPARIPTGSRNSQNHCAASVLARAIGIDNGKTSAVASEGPANRKAPVPPRGPHRPAPPRFGQARFQHQKRDRDGDHGIAEQDQPFVPAGFHRHAPPIPTAQHDPGEVMQQGHAGQGAGVRARVNAPSAPAFRPVPACGASRHPGSPRAGANVYRRP